MVAAGFALLVAAFAGGLLWVNELRKGFDQRLATRQVVQGANQRQDTRELQIKLNGTIRCWINGVIVEGCLRRQVVPQAKRQPLPQPRLQARRGIPGIRGVKGPGGAEGPGGPKGATGRPGRDGMDGQPGQDGAPGADAPPPTQAQVNAAVASLLPAGSGGVTMAQVEAAITAYCAAHNECRGPRGERGERGADSTVPGPMGPVGPMGPPGETIVQPPPEPTPPPDSTPVPVP